VKYFLGMAMNRLIGMKGVTVLRAAHMNLACAEDPRVYLQIDGEFAGNLPAELRIVPDAITLLAPVEYGEGEKHAVASGRGCA
jgi:diacylglycerol kinase family enzyme